VIVKRRAETWLAQSVAEPAPRRNIALGLIRGDVDSAVPPPNSSRGLRALAIPGAQARGGWLVADQPVDPQYAMLQQPESKLNTIAVERDEKFQYTVVVPGLDSPRTAETYTGAIDAVVDAMQGKAGRGEAWSLHFAGFDPDEVEKFTRTTEVHLDGIEVLGLSRPKETTFSSAYTSLHDRFDFRSARVVHSALETRSEAGGIERQVLRTDIEIPSIAQSRPPLLIRIFVKVLGPITAAIKAKVDLAIAKVLRRSSVSPAAWSPERIASSIKADLRRMNVQVELQLHLHAGDIYAAEDYNLVRHANQTQPSA